MEKIKCEVIRDLMPLVADDVASAESKELVSEHVESCEVCKAYFAGMTAQIARTAVPEDGPTSTFVKFTHRMEKRVRMKKVMIALTAAFVALCVVIVGGYVVFDRMNTYNFMPIEKTKAWLWHEGNGDVNVMVQMQDGHGWYDSVSMYREGDTVYLTPNEPELKLWNRGATGELYNVGWFDLLWEDGQLYYHLREYDSEYNPETGFFEEVECEYKIPLRLIRWGNVDNFATLYEKGDVLPTHNELMAQIEAGESAPDTPIPTPVAIATPEPSAKED